MIDINKKYQTRDGRPARILALGIKNKNYPIVAAVENRYVESIYLYTEDGKYHSDESQPSYNDLIEVKEKKKTKIWVGIGEGKYIYVTDSIDNMNERKASRLPNKLVAIKEIEIEYCEGEGLDD